MGVAGVAYATVIAQAVFSAILCFWKLLRMTDIFDFKFRHLKMKKKYTLEIIRLGLPSGITQAIFSMAMVIVQSLTNSFGEMVIAANVIIMRVDGFAMMPNFSFGTAMTTYAGTECGRTSHGPCGAGSPSRGTAIALGTSAVITLLILVFGKNLMAIFTDTSELVTLSANMMKILAVGYLAMAITQSLSGVMRGAGDTMTPHVDLYDHHRCDPCASGLRSCFPHQNPGTSKRKISGTLDLPAGMLVYGCAADISLL